MSLSETIRSITQRLVAGIVLHSEQVKVKVEPIGSRSGLVTISVANRGDMKRAVGGGGKHIEAIKVLLNMIGERQGIKLNAIVSETPDRTEEPYGDFVGRNKWPQDQVVQLLNDIVRGCLREPATISFSDHANFITSIVVRCADVESLSRCQKMQEALQPLFLAAGKKLGRTISVDIDHMEVDNPLKI